MRFGLVVLLIGCSRPPAQKMPEPEEKKLPGYATGNDFPSPEELGKNAVYYAEKPILEQLKAPTMAKFSDRELIDIKDGYAFVRMKVDAPNSFGVMLREEYCAVVCLESADKFSWRKGIGAVPCEQIQEPSKKFSFLAENRFPGAALDLAREIGRQRIGKRVR